MKEIPSGHTETYIVVTARLEILWAMSTEETLGRRRGGAGELVVLSSLGKLVSQITLYAQNFHFRVNSQECA